MFTYKRPNEISSTAGESFLAEGPTNEILDVYVSLGVWGGPLGLVPMASREHTVNDKAACLCPGLIRSFEWSLFEGLSVLGTGL